MGPPDTDSQDRPADSDQSILARIERGHHRIANLCPRELATAQEPSRIRELLDPLPDLFSKHFADDGGGGMPRPILFGNPRFLVIQGAE
jgi:hypothetical protein